MENIRYGRLDATDDEVIAAAKLANADSFIQELPYGYQAMITAMAQIYPRVSGKCCQLRGRP